MHSVHLKILRRKVRFGILKFDRKSYLWVWKETYTFADFTLKIGFINNTAIRLPYPGIHLAYLDMHLQYSAIHLRIKSEMCKLVTSIEITMISVLIFDSHYMVRLDSEPSLASQIHFILLLQFSFVVYMF